MKRWLRLEVESLPFAEVWDDIVASLGEIGQLETLAGQVPFRAAIRPGDEAAIRIETADGLLDVPRESVLEFWQQLRTYGYVAPNVLEADSERCFPYLVTMFARLPYVRPVRIAHNPSELDRPSALGLQWAPRSR